MDWWIVVTVLGEMAFLAFLIWAWLSYKAKRAKQRSEERLRLLERFESGEELNRFLASEGGEQFLELFATKPSTGTKNTLIATLSVGILGLALGIAFMILFSINTFDDGEPFLVAGLLCLFGGAGTIIASLLSRKLTKRWGENGQAS